MPRRNTAVRADPPDDELVSIGQVAQASGVTVETLRIWERRYGIPKPVRLPSGHRRYSQDQVRWLRRVSEALSHGHRPGKVLRADEAELDKILQRHRPVAESSPDVDARLDLVRAFRGPELIRSLLREWSPDRVAPFLENSIAPLVRGVGQAWADGELSIRHEHYFTETLEVFLRSLRSSIQAPLATPGILLTTLPGEVHGLGLQMVALHVASSGVRPLVLGTNTPIREILATAAETEVPVVGISVSLDTGGVDQQRQLVELRKRLPEEVALVVGGDGARGAGRGPRGVRAFDQTGEFLAWLHMKTSSNAAPEDSARTEADDFDRESGRMLA